MPGPSTTAVHAGHWQDDSRAHTMPIFQSSTFTYDNVEHGQAIWRGDTPGYIYSRVGNPNADVTASAIAALETMNLDQPAFGLMTASGMAAVSLITLSLLKKDDTILSQHSVYSSTNTIFREHMPSLGVNADFFDGHDLDSLDAALARNSNIRFIFIETPANPTMMLSDIEAIAKRAHAIGALLVVDNTFATPILQQPLALGADIVMHSTTKYLTGHGTVVGGAVIARDAGLHDLFSKTLRTYGLNAGPMDAWLTYNGLKTLTLRMRQHCENACQIAHFLEDHPAVGEVYYPGLASFPQHELATRQMNAYGGMIAFELKGGYDAGVALLNNLNFYTLAVSLGTVDSLIQHPASMTHFHLPPAVRQEMGISDGLVRISVGIEDAVDLIEDLEHAFEVLEMPANLR